MVVTNMRYGGRYPERRGREGLHARRGCIEVFKGQNHLWSGCKQGAERVHHKHEKDFLFTNWINGNPSLEIYEQEEVWKRINKHPGLTKRWRGDRRWCKDSLMFHFDFVNCPSFWSSHLNVSSGVAILILWNEKYCKNLRHLESKGRRGQTTMEEKYTGHWETFSTYLFIF